MPEMGVGDGGSGGGALPMGPTVQARTEPCLPWLAVARRTVRLKAALSSNSRACKCCDTHYCACLGPRNNMSCVLPSCAGLRPPQGAVRPDDACHRRLGQLEP